MSNEYDPDALNEQSEGDFDVSYTGTIVDIETGTAGDFITYSDGTVAAQNPSREAINVIVDTEADTTIEQVFTLPSEENPALSWRNPRFKLGRFKEYYGQVPEVGMDVEITVQDNGMLGIQLEPEG